MTTWDTTVDFVIVGSGGGGMTAALAAHDAGASALVLEKQARIGGSTCMSGGIVWVPDNPVMRADGVPDSYEDAMAHFEDVVGDVGPASSFERRHAFLTAGPEMISFLQDRGVRFLHCPGYSDYYSNAKGGHDEGRGVEPVPYDGRVLGGRRTKRVRCRTTTAASTRSRRRRGSPSAPSRRGCAARSCSRTAPR
jgi:3-oxosteroid 1-dehydrogenase